MIRLVIAFGVSLGLASACDCVRRSVKDAKRYSEVIFQGTIVEIHESSDGYHFPVATFKVTRVWKGHVGETCEMLSIQETIGCIGFVPTVKVGAEFLVYAGRLLGDLIPLQCQSDLVSRARDQIRELGSGRKPEKAK